MSDYIAKLIDPDILFSKLAKWMIAFNTREKSYIAEQPIPNNTNQIQHQHQHWDMEALLKRLGGKEERILRLAKLFLSGEASKKMNQIIECAKAEDTNAIRELAHSLKGAAGNLGAVALQQQAFTVESAAKNNDFESVHNAIPNLIHEH